jgi:hypothetical protein
MKLPSKHVGGDEPRPNVVAQRLEHHAVYRHVARAREKACDDAAVAMIHKWLAE